MHAVSMKKMFFSVMAAMAFSAVMGLGSVALAKDAAPAKTDENASKAAWNIPLSQAERADLKDMRVQLKAKREILRAVFHAPEFDEAKARSIYAEMQTLITAIAQKRFDAAVEYKKANMDWKPGDKMPGKKGKKAAVKPAKEPAADADPADPVVEQSAPKSN